MYLFSLCISVAMAMKPSINVCCNRKYYSALYAIHYLAAIIKKVLQSIILKGLVMLKCTALEYTLQLP